MLKETQRKAAELAREIEREIKMLEAELDHKKELLNALNKLEFGLFRTGKKMGRPPKMVKTPASNGRRGRNKSGVKGQMTNKEMIMEVASEMKGPFALGELNNKIQERYPGFGGKYALGTIISIIKSSSEIKKVKRGHYKYTGRN